MNSMVGVDTSYCSPRIKKVVTSRRLYGSIKGVISPGLAKGDGIKGSTCDDTITIASKWVSVNVFYKRKGDEDHE